jgi:hypothetical protein
VSGSGADARRELLEPSRGDESADRQRAPAVVATQVARLRQPLAVLIRAGSVAGAVLSIFGLVVLVVHSVDGTDSGADKVTTVLENGRKITLGVDRAVERMTYGRWLELETGSREGVASAEQQVPGVNVRYTAKFPAYASGAPFKARFTLLDQTGSTRHRHTAIGHLDADRDLCTCAEFVPVPKGPSSYRVLVELYRPDARYAAPVLSRYTDWFSAAQPVAGG